MRSVRSVSSLLALALIAVGATATAAQAAEPEPGTGECVNLASCTSIPNTPWVVVPAATLGFTSDHQGVIEPGTVLWRVDCPASKVPAGRDYVVSKPGQLLIVTAFVLPFNIGITGTPSASFYAVWEREVATSFQPLVGCIPKAASASAAAGSTSRLRQRTFTHALHPGQTKTFAHGCAKGERLASSEHGVGFYRDSPPAEAELKGLRVTRRDKGGRVVVQVRTGKMVGDDERAEIQIHALCGPVSKSR